WVAGLGQPAVPGLVDCLGQPDEQVCANAHLALERVTAGWGPDDARPADLALRLARTFPRLSPAGQCGAQAVAGLWFAARPPPRLVPACARMLTEAATASDPQVQAGPPSAAG